MTQRCTPAALQRTSSPRLAGVLEMASRFTVAALPRTRCRRASRNGEDGAGGDEDVAGLHTGSPATTMPSPWTSLAELRMSSGYTPAAPTHDAVALDVARGDEDVAGLHTGSPATTMSSPWTSLAELRMSPGYTPAAPTHDAVALDVACGDEDVAGLHMGSPATMMPSPWTSLAELWMSPGYTPAALPPRCHDAGLHTGSPDCPTWASSSQLASVMERTPRFTPAAPSRTPSLRLAGVEVASGCAPASLHPSSSRLAEVEMVLGCTPAARTPSSPTPCALV
ncbi:hypothetical protein QYE76_071500 [Lolium multiflorum]|uniref:Uncharacterized protein n=1 Tax=Lolium multiflorum TaxID=4521 RepID=A0AAD8SJW7_LOLMU|nr:hypothetical protein QYE76_071500 [Lolium multiflorum]